MPQAHDLPALQELGKDLLAISRWNLAVSLLRPIGCFVLFWPLALSHRYMLAALAVIGLMLFSYASTSHDLVHRTLRLPVLLNEWLLAVLEGITLRSGHAYRLTHLQHHKRFPHEDDIEGAEPSKGLWHSLLCGPTHQVRLFIWAWQHGARNDRRWMAWEATFIVGVVSLAVVSWRQFPALAFYAGLVVLGSWLYPFATVWLPHSAEGATMLEQTWAVRGRLIPLILFQHTYHLEHHLYPGISSHHWQELGRRLKPYLDKSGVHIVQLP